MINSEHVASQGHGQILYKVEDHFSIIALLSYQTTISLQTYIPKSMMHTKQCVTVGFLNENK